MLKIMKLKIGIIALGALLLIGGSCRAQNRFEVQGYGFYDFHYATGGIGGGAVTFDWHPFERYTLGVGAEYASSNRISAFLRGEAVLAGSPWGKHLSLENRYLMRQFPDLNIQEMNGLLALTGHLRHANLSLGLCNRYTASLVLRENGGSATVFEPMNVAFAVEGWWLDEACEVAAPLWNIGLRWCNYNDFIIERVANWFFCLKGYYTMQDGTRLVAEAGVHPVGSLNLTASYDGWWMHLGAVRRF